MSVSKKHGGRSVYRAVGGQYRSEQDKGECKSYRGISPLNVVGKKEK